MDLIAFLILRGIFAIKVCTLIEGLIVHPHAGKRFLAIRFAQPRLGVHALALDKLNFGIDLENLLFGHYFFFLLDY